MGVRLRRQAVVLVGPLLLAGALLLAACGGDDSGASAPTSSAPTEVLTAEQLADLLVTPADLDGDWQTDESPFGDWPNGEPGVVPEDPEAELPTPSFCEEASAEAWAAADLQWQAFTQLIDYPDATTEGVGHGLIVSVGLLSGDAAELEARFADLHDGVTACLGGPTDLGYAIWTSEELDLGDVGDEGIASHDVFVGEDGSQTSTYSVAIVRRGTILMYINLMEFAQGAETEALLSNSDIQYILIAASAKLP